MTDNTEQKHGGGGLKISAKIPSILILPDMQQNRDIETKTMSNFYTNLWSKNTNSNKRYYWKNNLENLHTHTDISIDYIIMQITQYSYIKVNSPKHGYFTVGLEDNVFVPGDTH